VAGDDLVVAKKWAVRPPETVEIMPLLFEIFHGTARYVAFGLGNQF